MPYEGFWTAVRLGGTTGALDKIDGDDLSDKDMAALLESTDTARFWWLDDDASGSEGETVVNPDTNVGTKSWRLLGITVPNIGLHILDTDASHDLIIQPGSDLSADRTLTLITGDANRTLDLAENLKILDGQDIELHASGGEKAQLAIDTQNAERTLNMSENLTIANGCNVTLQALGQANSLILNEGFTIGDGSSGTLTFSQASKTLRVEDNSYVNQDLTTDASPSFTKVISTELEYAGNITIDAANAGGNSLVYILNSTDYTASLSVEAHLIVGGNINALNLTAEITGFTIVGGTTDKTLTLDDDFVASTQLAAIGANTGKVTESSTVTAPLVLTTYDISIPAATSSANGYMTSTYAGKLDGIDTGAADDQTEAEILTLLGLTAVEVDQVGNIAATTISEAQWGYLGGATANGGALIDAADYAAMMALLSETATAAFSFNSQNLTGVGDIAATNLTLTSAVSQKPRIILKSTKDDPYAPGFEGNKERSDAAVDGDYLFEFASFGKSDAPANNVQYCSMYMISSDVSSNHVGGQIRYAIKLDNAWTQFLDMNGYNGVVGQGYLEINGHEADVDFIVNAFGVSNAFMVDGADGGVFASALLGQAAGVHKPVYYDVTTKELFYDNS